MMAQFRANVLVVFAVGGFVVFSTMYPTHSEPTQR